MITTSNSYVTLIEGDDYFAGRFGSDLWTALTNDNKEKALITATYRIDNERFAGLKLDSAQALQWPRYGLTDNDGFPLSGIPTNLKRAVCEYAYFILEEQILTPYEEQIFETWSVKGVDVKINTKNAGQLPLTVRQFLYSIGPSAWVNPKIGCTSIVR